MELKWIKPVLCVFLLIGAVAVLACPTRADVISIGLTQPIDFVPSGGRLSSLPGPYGNVRVELLSPTVATVTFTSAIEDPNIYLFEVAVGVNPHAVSFAVSDIVATNSGTGFLPVQNIQAVPGGCLVISCFKLRIDFFNVDDPIGIWEHSVDLVQFTLTNLTDSWSSASDVLGPRPVDASGLQAGAEIGVTPYPANAANGELLRGAAFSDQLPIPAPNPATFWLFIASIFLASILSRRWRTRTWLDKVDTSS